MEKICQYPFLVADAYKTISDWPKISPNDSSGLRKFSDFFNQPLSAMRSTTFLNVLNAPTENRRMVKKLPTFMIDKRIFEAELLVHLRIQTLECRVLVIHPSLNFASLLKSQDRLKSCFIRPSIPPIRSLKTDTGEVGQNKGPIKATCIY